jgi:hypothetical protein
MAMSDTTPHFDIADHERTFRNVVRGAALFIALVAIVLLSLAYIFANRMG